MEKITFPLQPEMQGAEVANLQDGLLFLLEKDIFQLDEVTRKRVTERLRIERADEIYQEATFNVVRLFQSEHRLEPSGLVDEPTAETLNALLEELGAFNPTPPEQERLVGGQVQRQDGQPLPNALVRAYHLERRDRLHLGENTTDARGSYKISYSLLPGISDIQLSVVVFDDSGKPLSESEVIHGAKALEIVNLTVPIVTPPVEQRRIEGRIVLEYGLPAQNITLRLYRRDFGGQVTLLDATTTGIDGQYAFSYDPQGKTSSLEVRALKDGGEEIALSKPLNNISGESRLALNLVAPGSLQPLAPEYQRLSADLTAQVGQMANLANARENAQHQDLTVLNRATGWDARLIALAATTEQLSADPDVKLPQEFVYGLLRAGLPSDKRMLAQVEPEVAEQALKTVRDAGIVELNDQQIGEFKQQFATFATRVRLDVPTPGSRSTYGELLGAVQLKGDNPDVGQKDETTRTKFASIYLNHRGDPFELWQKAVDENIAPEDIQVLQRQGKFAFLAGNSQAMTTRLMQKPIHDPAQLVEQDFHRADSWVTEILLQAGIPVERRDNLTETDKEKLDAEIPSAYAAEKVEDRLELYAEDMARKVRLSYPTQVVAHMVEADEIKLPAARVATAALLKNAAGQGFRLGQTPVATFFKTHTGVTAGMPASDVQAAQQQLKTLQRVYQITPGDEAMPVLISLGMTSAYDVTEYSEEQFVELYVAKYKELYETEE